jgi:hypothetical protein
MATDRRQAQHLVLGNSRCGQRAVEARLAFG